MKKALTCSVDQRRFLLQEVARLTTNFPTAIEYKSRKKPSYIKETEQKIRQLQQTVDEWDREETKRRKEFKNTLAQDCSAIRQKTYFGPPAEALQALEEFKKKYSVK